jgi:hypothetical protein
MGQFGELSSSWNFDWKCDNEARDVAEKMLQSVKRTLTPLYGNQFYSISSPEIPDSWKIAYDIHQVIRFRLAWDRDPNDNWNVHKNEPMRYGSSELATIKGEDK